MMATPSPLPRLRIHKTSHGAQSDEVDFASAGDAEFVFHTEREQLLPSDIKHHHKSGDSNDAVLHDSTDINNFLDDSRIIEQYGRKEIRNKYIVGDHEIECVAASRNKSFMEHCKDIFLPEGFPHTVSADYVPYQIYDTLQAFCSSITGALATEATLKAAGVGDESRTALAAALVWIAKDGFGKVASIWFVWAKALNSREFDMSLKRWRLAADVFNDLSLLVCLLAPLFPGNFLFLMCLASVLGAFVGAAGGATRTTLRQHQALADNLADVTAKDGSQETMVNLVALLLNLGIVACVSGRTTIVWLLYIVFTCLHLTFNYLAVKSIVIHSFNMERMRFACRQFFADDQDGSVNGNGTVPTPAAANYAEKVVFPAREPFEIRLGQSLRHVQIRSYLWLQLVQLFVEEERFVCVPCIAARRIYVFLSKRATNSDTLKAVFNALLIEHELVQHLAAKKKHTQHEQRGRRGLALLFHCFMLIKRAIFFVLTLGLWKKFVERDVCEPDAVEIARRARAEARKSYGVFISQARNAHWLVEVIHAAPGQWRLLLRNERDDAAGNHVISHAHDFAQAMSRSSSPGNVRTASPAGHGRNFPAALHT